MSILAQFEPKIEAFRCSHKAVDEECGEFEAWLDARIAQQREQRRAEQTAWVQRLNVELRASPEFQRELELGEAEERGAWRALLAQDQAAAVAEAEAILSAPQPAPEAPTRGLFRTLSWADLQSRPPVAWLIHNTVPAGGMAVLYGPSGVGKSFAALNMALSVATGSPWLGLEGVQVGEVVYVAAEGVAGIPARVRAWLEAHGQPELDRIHFVEQAVSFMDAGEVEALLVSLRLLPEPPALVIVDTMARCLVGGEENSARDVGLFIAGVDRIRAELGAAVLVVHHTGKTGDSERGSSALRGAADTMLSLTGDEGALSLACTKQKDAEPFDKLNLRLMPVDAAGSCVVEYTEFRMPSHDLTDSQIRVLEALRDAFGHEGASSTALMQASALPAASFYRARKALVDRGCVDTENKRYVLTDKGRRAVRATLLAPTDSEPGGEPWE